MKSKRNPRGAGRKRKLTPLEESHCYEEYKAGKRAEEIAYKNGVSLSTISRIIREGKEREGLE